MVGLGILWVVVLGAWAYIAVRNHWPEDEMQVHSVLMLAAITLSIVLPWSQLSHIEGITYERQCQRVYESRVNTLLPQLESVLKAYPDYERDTLMGYAQGQQTLLGIPPNLKSDKVAFRLVDEIKNARDRKYKCEVKIADHQYAIRVNKRIGRLLVVWLPVQ